jgi:hypothetical protein
MARRKSIGIRSRLKGLISGQLLGKLARESGYVKRIRKVDPVKLSWPMRESADRSVREWK